MAVAEPRGERLPPQNLECEMAVIGCLLVDRNTADAVLPVVQPSDFYAHVNEIIYRAILVLHAAERPIDVLSVATYLREHGNYERCGGLPYLNSLMNTVPTAANAEYYAQVVREKADLRSLIALGTRFSQIGFDGEADVKGALDAAEEAYGKMLDRSARKRGGSISLFEAMKQNYLRLAEFRLRGAPTGAQITPWPSLNTLTGAFEAANLVAWVGAPAMGKTAVLLAVADWCRQYGQVVLVSLEMSAREIAQRYAAMHGGVQVGVQRNAATLTEMDMERISAAGSRFADFPSIVIIDGENANSLAEIKRELRHIAKDGPIATIVMDGITFLTDVEEKGGGDRSTETQRLDRVYKSLLRIAKTHGSVLHVSQHLNREGMKGRPTLTQLRGGGNLEGHAHAIIAPYREGAHGTPEEQAVGEMGVLKVREGRGGVVDGFYCSMGRSLWCDPMHNRLGWFEKPGSRISDRDEAEYYGYEVPA